MTQLDGRSSTLVVDPDADYLEWIKSDPACQLAPPLIASSEAEALSILEGGKQAFSGIFVNPKIVNPRGLSIIRSAHQHHAGTPLFLLCDGDSPYGEQELRKLAVHKALRKPLSYAELLALVAPIAPSFPGAAAALARAGTRLGEAEPLLNESEFSPIRIENFLSGNKSFFDVFVRLGDGRFVKILHVGDAFSEDRVESYLRKGVTSFFIRKSAQADYVGYCEHLSSRLVRHTEAPTGLKVSQTLNSGEETLRFLSERGVSEGGILHAVRFSDNIRRIVDELEIAEHPSVRDFIADAAAYDHAVATTLVAGLMLPPLKIGLDRLRNAIGVAALLHDIGLHKSARHLEDKEEHEMTDEERRVYRLHPQNSAKILMSATGVDPVTLQAVYQHHERRDGKGFPKNAGCGTITLAAEVVGICDEFVRLLRRAKKDRSIDPLAYMRLKIFDGFSYRVMKAFIDVMWV